MLKILIIGQAPPAVKQDYPYDTTMLYEWFRECGISKNEAQDKFEFEALMGTFPGYTQFGGHRKPSYLEMKAYWESTLETKVQLANKVILLGRPAADWFNAQRRTWSCNLDVLELIHPSTRNRYLFEKNKESIISKLKEFIS